MLVFSKIYCICGVFMYRIQQASQLDKLAPVLKSQPQEETSCKQTQFRLTAEDVFGS